MADAKKAATPVEIITDEASVKNETPVLTVKTGQTDNQKFWVRINQPQGRATLIAVHL